MTKLAHYLLRKRYAMDQRGASASEYALILCVVGLGIGASALVLGANVRVRKIAGTGQGVADGLAASLRQPDRLGRIGEVCAGLLQAVSLGQETGQVLRRIEGAEGLGEGGPADRGQGFGVGEVRTAQDRTLQ